jgi:hypothetical protein
MNASYFKVLPISLFFMMKTLTLTGQVSYVHGRVLEGDSGWPVDRVLVQNVSAHRWTSSDTAGYFHLPATAGDTLVFSAAGYYHRVEFVTDSLLNSAVFHPFKLDPLIYPIQEANVFALGSYSEFRQKFINLDLSKDKTEILRSEIQKESLTAARDAYKKVQEQQKTSGLSVSVPILTPQEKERIRLREILAAENQKNQVYKKYNPAIVRKITGITNDEEIIAFMLFCHFSDEWILQINEYDLMVIIARKYEEYQRIKKGMGSDRKGIIPDVHALQVDNKIC